MPVVSVGLPVYNGERYLSEALDSLLAQSVRDIEIVIADNASTDRTAEICRSYEARDERVRYVRNERNIGAAPNFNRVFELSSAPLFHGGACDDLYEPLFLQRCIEALDRDPGVVLGHARTRLIGERGEPLVFDEAHNCYLDSHGGRRGTSGDVMRPQPLQIGEAHAPEARFRDVLWRMGWSLPLSGVIRTSALLKTSLYGVYSGADKVLLAELALQGRFHEVREQLFAKRIHQECTHYMSTRERAEHEGVQPRGIPQLHMLRDYSRMVLAADMGTRQRLHCLLTIAGVACRGEVWRRLLVPGRDNYLGLSFGGR
ncbi:glycosyltransferase [Geminicoccaceae bacterium 1502E]|nr:glycosyltransferase [Geminicoccaceae bacterium 1502E]